MRIYWCLYGRCVEVRPKEWNVPAEIVKEKIRQLFDDNWIEECWKNFVECLNNNRNEN